MRSILLFVLSALLLFPAVGLATIILKTRFQASSPKFIRTAEGTGGLCFDIIEELNRRLAPRGIRISYPVDETPFMPWKRIQISLNTGDIDLVVGMAKNKRRLQLYNFSEEPLYSVRSVFAVPAGSSFSYRSPRDLQGKTVIAVRGTRTAREIAAAGGITLSLSRDPSTALKMLLAGRGDMIFFHDLGLAYVIRKNNCRNAVRLEPGMGKYDHFIAYNRAISPAIRKAIDQQIGAMKNDGTMKALLLRYR